ncbi:cysteine synthase A [Candidatus Aerophobetes bacterium]|nr:cysteine synthase A [Candidatus Aerophobetes bacterium]
MKNDILETIGNTPLIKLNRINNTDSEIFVKLENLNPSGSIKDVMTLYMIKSAEKKGILKPGSKIMEVTTGNTGISFAMISAVKGYKFIAVMPENMSIERRKIMQILGAEVVLTPAEENMNGAIKKFEELAKKERGVWLPLQFKNIDNIRAHKEITGREILKKMKKKIDIFVAGVGTGGTLMGVAATLREVNPHTKIIAVEPSESAVMSGRTPGPHNIQGIGEGFIPPLMKMDILSEIISVSTREAMNMSRRLAKEEGLLVGISSGANVFAALKIAKKFKGKNTIVTILPDTGERYLTMM